MEYIKDGQPFIRKNSSFKMGVQMTNNVFNFYGLSIVFSIVYNEKKGVAIKFLLLFERNQDIIAKEQRIIKCVKFN